MPDIPLKGRLKSAVAGEPPDVFFAPLTPADEKKIEHLVTIDGWERCLAERELRHDRYERAKTAPPPAPVIRAGEEVEVIAVIGYPLQPIQTPDEEIPLWVKNDRGIGVRTKLGNLEPIT
jgi:hypothetical protein